MLKLLYIPTNNVFTLPDEEALRIKNEDRGNNYKILNEDYVEKQIEQPKEKTIKELVMADDDNSETEQAPIQEEEITQDKKPITIEDLKEMNRFALYGLAQRLDLKPKSNANKATLLKLLRETGIFN